MITGTVANRRPTVSLEVHGPNGKTALVEAHIDTGFNGFLSLPSDAVAALSLPHWSYYHANLADGSGARMAVHIATVTWDGAEREVEVLVAERRPLLGTALLDGYELTVRFTDDGLVTIEAV